MGNKRAKIKKTKNNPETNSFSEALSADHYTHSGAKVGSSDDLLTEILLRLPVTSIFRFKSVSKHWQSLLSSRRFTLSYDKVLISPGLFVRDLYIPFDVENQTPPPFRNLNFIPDRCGIRFLQSCNGLLLCCSHRGKEHTRKYYVFNPTTKQFAVIPSIVRGSDEGTTIRFMGLAFHPTDFVHYKVVCFLNKHSFRNAHYNTKSFQIQIYSSDTRRWRILEESFLSSCHRSSSYGVYWNGAMHWSPDSSHMIYFKFDVEKLQKVWFPKRAPSCSGPLYFGESGGHLHLVETAGYETPLHINVYEMLSDYSGWFIKYRVELDELLVAYPDVMRSNSNRNRPSYQFEVLDVVRGVEEESTFVVVRIAKKIIRYDIVNKSFETITDLPNDLCHERLGYTNVHRFTQTLFSF